MTVKNDAEFSKGQSVNPAPSRANETLPEKYFWKPHSYLVVNVKCTFWSLFSCHSRPLEGAEENSNHKKRKATKVSLEIMASYKSTQKTHCIMSKEAMQRCFKTKVEY